MQGGPQSKVRQLQWQLRQCEEERDSLRRELDSRLDPERLHHLLLYGLPFLLGGMALMESSLLSVGEIVAGAAILVAIWSAGHRFYKYRAQGGFELVTMLSAMSLGTGVLLGIIAGTKL